MSQKYLIWGPVTRRPLVTSDSRLTRLPEVMRAAFRASSGDMRSYSLMPVEWWRDWAHHLQSSLHRPERALTIEQVSIVSPVRARRIWSAVSQRVSSGADFPRSRASSTVSGEPSRPRLSASWIVMFRSVVDCCRRQRYVFYLRGQKIVVPLQPGKSYTTSSPGTPPGLDRSNGTGL